MLEIGLKQTAANKKLPYKRYKVQITVYDKSRHCQVEVYDKQEERVIFKTVNKRQLIDNKKEIEKKFTKLKCEFVEKRLYEEYTVEKHFHSEVDLVASSLPKSEFAVFVIEVNRFLKEYKYNFKPIFTRKDGNLNVVFEHLQEKSLYNRIEKVDGWYIHTFKDRIIGKARQIETLFKR